MSDDNAIRLNIVLQAFHVRNKARNGVISAARGIERRHHSVRTHINNRSYAENVAHKRLKTLNPAAPCKKPQIVRKEINRELVHLGFCPFEDFLGRFTLFIKVADFENDVIAAYGNALGIHLVKFPFGISLFKLAQSNAHRVESSAHRGGKVNV